MGSVTDVDVAIVGAGPAGSAAAVYLARAGRIVSVVDKATFPRDKPCGDGLTTGALRELERVGVRPEQIPSWQVVEDIEIHDPAGRCIELRLPVTNGQYAAVARRRELDAVLVEHARAAGAQVIEGTPVTQVRAGADTTTLSLDSGESLRAAHVIAADGMWSPVRKMIGRASPAYRGDWHAFRQYFTGASDNAQKRLIVWFEPDLLPGYAWSFPLGDGAVNVGFGIRRQERLSGAEMNRLWSELLRRPTIRRVLGPTAEPETRHRAWPIPARVGELPLNAGGILFAGDAAAATDPMTGEGIGQALQTGRLAAQAIIEATSGTDAGIAYNRLVRRGFVADHRMARTLGAVLARPIGVRAALRLIDASAWSRDNFARWLFEDYPRAILLTPRRWTRPLLGGPPAYVREDTAKTQGQTIFTRASW